MICFWIGNIEICIPIPILIRAPWWPPPNGDPWKRLGSWVEESEPDPHPWRENVAILATVAALAEHAQGELKGRLEQMVRAETAEIKEQLPEGASLKLGGEAG